MCELFFQVFSLIFIWFSGFNCLVLADIFKNYSGTC